MLQPRFPNKGIVGKILRRHLFSTGFGNVSSEMGIRDSTEYSQPIGIVKFGAGLCTRPDE